MTDGHRCARRRHESVLAFFSPGNRGEEAIVNEAGGSESVVNRAATLISRSALELECYQAWTDTSGSHATQRTWYESNVHFRDSPPCSRM